MTAALGERGESPAGRGRAGEGLRPDDDPWKQLRDGNGQGRKRDPFVLTNGRRS